MSQPTAGEVSVATNVLRSEAGQWETQAGKLTSLSTEAAGMEFGRLEAGLFQAMVGPYNDVINAVTARATEGATAMKEIAATLRNAANTYEAEDQAGAHRLKNIY
ncbi:hypothetical protein GCM10010168_16520 [Actinoplanes ianthinogenes]|uniref:Excreted virulence factor EspC (Type VII ESX diderm) n=1 Tax=Actinoplanes ianthinogenes TaxID=122358 RepID=A0ABN6CJF0_9ACTN|nr:type VII secretion target [Actinoplanes ianthinogenes]BCJ44839.1 hypothetical protein Aiant_54960 [Actinoplanes ianthinogenes]GGR00299.1 hypothetical protein GCM10010168_16520 [Actinoplanes ianthinogenes]